MICPEINYSLTGSLIIKYVKEKTSPLKQYSFKGGVFLMVIKGHPYPFLRKYGNLLADGS
jgi:hypothetical protein